MVDGVQTGCHPLLVFLCMYLYMHLPLLKVGQPWDLLWQMKYGKVIHVLILDLAFKNLGSSCFPSLSQPLCKKSDYSENTLLRGSSREEIIWRCTEVPDMWVMDYWTFQLNPAAGWEQQWVIPGNTVWRRTTQLNQLREQQKNGCCFGYFKLLTLVLVMKQ